MIAHPLTITYVAEAAGSNSASVTLEQAPLPRAMSVVDLQAMLSVVLGTSQAAEAYTPDDCPATISSGQIVVPLTVWAWPSDLRMSYQLRAASGTVADPVRIQQEREFDQVINFVSETVLPFFCNDISWTWSELGVYSRTGGLIDPPPSLAVDGSTIRSGGDFLGVIRVRCLAVGYAHTVTMTIDKANNDKISDIRNSVTASWADTDGQTRATALDLTLPDCVQDLAALCPDGSLVKTWTGSVNDKEETVPVVYYNDCNGRVILVRNE
ncbi:MAG: hypothetical protein AB7U29_03440 [Desulfobulbus sp.]